MTDRNRCKDEEVLDRLVQQHVTDPHNLSYTENLKGDVEPEMIEKHHGYVVGAIEACPPHGAIVQSALCTSLFEQAVAKEQTWHLGSIEKQKEWAEKQATMRLLEQPMM